MIALENWWIPSQKQTDFISYNRRGKNCLAGFTAEHPSLRPGDIITSPIVEMDGNRVETESGSVYLLGNVCPEYRKKILPVPITQAKEKAYENPKEGTG